MVRFGDYAIDTAAMRLTRDGEDVPLEPQVFGLLAYLAGNRDRVVTKDEIVAEIWNGRAVSDGAITSRINAVRRAVGDDGKTQGVIRTIPMRGFRFVAEVGEPKMPAAGSATRLPIAVLPFRNLSSDPEQKYFADGMLEDLVMKLSRIRWLLVISNATTATFPPEPKETAGIADALDVRFLLTGSIRRAESLIRVTARLVDARDGAAIWAETFDREPSDIFRVQDEITAKVVASVENEIGVVEQREADRADPENLAAWACYQRAMSRIRNDAAVFGRGEIETLFDQALENDPDFALAHAGRAFWEYFMHIEGQRSADMELAFRHAERAIELDPREAFAHHVLGALHFIKGHHDSSKLALEHAIELNPSFAWAYHLLAVTLTQMGDLDRAETLIREAIRLSPRDTLIGIFLAGLALVNFCRGDYDAAIDLGRKAMVYPQPRWVHLYVLSSLVHAGRRDEIGEMLTLISRVRPEFTLHYVRRTFPLLQGEARDRMFEGLVKAELPDR